MNDTEQRIKDALAWVDTEFPFDGYITDGARHGTAHVVRQVQRYIPNSTESPHLLDIGCGPMDKTAVFQRLGFQCCAVDDLSDPWHFRGDSRARIKEFAAKAGIQFHLQQADNYSIPFEKDSFDVVSVMAVIEHLHSSPRGILNAAGSFLKPGGLLCVTMPNAVNLRKRLHVLLGKTNYPPIDQVFAARGEWRGHVREYTLAETKAICRLAGFVVVSATTCEGNAYDMLRGPLLAGFLMLSHLFPCWRSEICVLARKPANWLAVTENGDGGVGRGP
jgi:SAM-dependent methyltransferase